jgi:uncharacterized membrane protein HdeD (DUF308 family)
MEKNFTSRTITGSIIIIFGIILTFFTLIYGRWTSLILGIPLIILGIYIFVNKNEDKIEKRKDMKGGRLKGRK